MWRLWVAALLAIVSGCSDRAPEGAPHATGAPKDKSAADRSGPAATGPRSFAEFRPSEHGFKFGNNFAGDALGGLGKNLGLPTKFGLCGGMSAAAADYFLARRPVPTQTEQPVEGTALYSYIYARQAASNGFLGSMGVKYVEWMQLPDAEVQRRTRLELPDIIAAIKRGEPVMIGEVLQVAGGKAWTNHQVLAYGVSEERGVVRIRIYDPSFPRNDDLAIQSSPSGFARVGGGITEREIRGFFRTGYGAVDPEQQSSRAAKQQTRNGTVR